jgi:uncharacterized protein
MTQTHKISAEDLERLEQFLDNCDDDVMSLAVLDGFLSGVAVCPDLISPSEWLPVVWGGGDAPFRDVAQANEIFALMMAFYNSILIGLNAGEDHRPVMLLDRDDTQLWEIWAEGFRTALGLKPGSWRAYAKSRDETVRTSCSFLMALVDSSDSEGKLPEDLDRELRSEADSLITESLKTLHATRLASHPAATMPKVGRNEPCPCGSGRKFKHCCLM